ncbi:MAG: AAA family ATPase [Muribaculaceae bacterium]|nr:AAA family ATPase [Muribaculaceae bacterium]
MKYIIYLALFVCLLGVVIANLTRLDAVVVTVVLFIILIVVIFGIAIAKNDEPPKPDASPAPQAAQPARVTQASAATVKDAVDDEDVVDDNDSFLDDIPEDIDPQLDDLDEDFDNDLDEDFDDVFDDRELTHYEVELGPKRHKAALQLAEQAKQLCKTLSRDNKLRRALNALASDEGNSSASSFNMALQCFYMQDLCRCYEQLGMEPEIDYYTPQGQLLYVIIGGMLGSGDTSYPAFKRQMLWDDDTNSHLREIHEDALDVFRNSNVEISNSEVEDYSLAMMLQAAGFERHYMMAVRELLYDSASLVYRCTCEEDDHCKQVLEIMKKQCDVTDDEENDDDDDNGNEPVLTASSLDELVGLESVKEQVTTLKHFVQMNRKREAMGLSTPVLSLHCVFTGNPGTGKTTVARIIAAIFKEMGVLKKGHLVETDRSGLVAEYLGQTAIKTNKIIDSALDGVLFIDEAYTLAQGTKGDYGQEAIATLLKRMEDNRDRLVVILAGYGKEIEDFINSNPGLRSRFNRYIHFDDYSASELQQIFELMAQKYDFQLDHEAKQLLKTKLEEAVAYKDKDFGNARFVRNAFEKTIEAQAVRLAQLPDASRQQLSLIIAHDLEQAL